MISKFVLLGIALALSGCAVSAQIERPNFMHMESVMPLCSEMQYQWKTDSGTRNAFRSNGLSFCTYVPGIKDDTTGTMRVRCIWRAPAPSFRIASASEWIEEGELSSEEFNMFCPHDTP